MAKYHKEPGKCPDCGHILRLAKMRGKHTYYVCHPCKHRANPSKDTTVRAYHLSKKGVTPEWYEKKLEEQDYLCAICRTPEIETRDGKIKNFNIDHDHSHCKEGCPECIRGLLCSKCNRGLGKFNDDTDLLKRALAYLWHYKDIPENI